MSRPVECFSRLFGGFLLSLSPQGDGKLALNGYFITRKGYSIAFDASRLTILLDISEGCRRSACYPQCVLLFPS
ncbi:hypothetical protein BDN71DRAFT_1446112 [Pleurotus eryngii]|uniref:Uncharacterized protein n=1 Tax=Pleurotus eryngii TaxID=5323 RepID=A0A9P5ZYL1_PLEER|nr:hypothetical protein BDN71DRAFT_1446112 [Pleurotus eryngii]